MPEKAAEAEDGTAQRLPSVPPAGQGNAVPGPALLTAQLVHATLLRVREHSSFPGPRSYGVEMLQESEEHGEVWKRSAVALATPSLTLAWGGGGVRDHRVPKGPAGFAPGEEPRAEG